MSEDLPGEIAGLLAERATARANRDWTAADALRDRLRELGWEAIDSSTGSTARRILPAAEDQGSLLDQPAAVACSLVAVVDDHPGDLVRFITAWRAHPPRVDHELIVVANAPPGGRDALPGIGEEDTLLTSHQRLGWADAANLGLRRARGAVVILVDTSIEPTDDFVTPLLAAFDDSRVGLTGPWGVSSRDGRQFDEAPPGEVDAIEGYCLAIRRDALRQVGGFDHRFRFYRNADLDLSFAVRANGWRAERTLPVPLLRHEHRGWTAYPDAERARLSRRNFYRFLKHWGDRRDLLTAPG